jgi:hypothetical protein
MRLGPLRLRAPLRSSLTLTGLAAGALVLALTAAPAVTAPTATRAVGATVPTPVLFGTAVGSEKELAGNEKVAGRKVIGYRIYKSWDEPLFSSWELHARDTNHIAFTSIKSKTGHGATVSWASIAAARPGSAAYSSMVARAKEAKAYGRVFYLAFNHEPTAGPSKGMGTPAQFVAAWRALHDVFEAQGVTNVRWVWTMVAWSFADGSADAYYPGDGYVDAIGADGYNWNRCRSAKDTWTGFATIFDGQRRFGLRHPGKQLVVMELGSVEDPAVAGRKAAWWNDVRQVLRRPEWSQYSVLLTWNGRNVNLGNGCKFDFASSASSQSAWVRMRQDWFLSTWRVIP